MAMTFARPSVTDLVTTLSVGAMSILLATSCAGNGTPAAGATPSPVEGALSQGLIAYVAANGLGGLDPATGKSTIVSPLPAGAAFRIAGPVWAPAPGLSYPVLYFTIHDDRPAERRTSPGAVRDAWGCRADLFHGDS